jgi:hypothetical protein
VNLDYRGQELPRAGLGDGIKIREAVMRRSPLSHRLLLCLALLLTTLPLVALAFAAPAWAATAPAPSPGPPVVPTGAPLSDAFGILLTGALLVVAALALAALIVALGSRRSTAAATLPAGRGMTLEGPLALGQSSFTVLPHAGREQRRTRRPAA